MAGRESGVSPDVHLRRILAEELNKIFQNIQSTITQSRSLTGVQVTDVIDAEFELTDAEIQRLRADGAQVTVKEDGTTTVSWA